MFKAYVQCDNFRFKMREGFWLLQKKGNLFLFINSYLRIPKENKRKHPEVSKGNMYGYRELYDITMTLSVTRCE